MPVGRVGARVHTVERTIREVFIDEHVSPRQHAHRDDERHDTWQLGDT